MSPTARRGLIVAVLLIGVILVGVRMLHREPAPTFPPPPPPPIQRPVPVEKPVPPPLPKPAAQPITKPRPVTPPPRKVIPPPPKVTPSTLPPAIPPTLPLPPPAPPAPELQEWQGNDTSITHDGQVVIKNDRQWVKFWSEHHPHEPAPDVDFTRNMVIGVFAGSRPAEAFKIDIVGTREVLKTLYVDYRETLPPTGTLAVGVTVYPYHIKVVPQTPLRVKFRIIETKR